MKHTINLKYQLQFNLKAIGTRESPEGILRFSGNLDKGSGRVVHLRGICLGFRTEEWLVIDDMPYFSGTILDLEEMCGTVQESELEKFQRGQDRSYPPDEDRWDLYTIPIEGLPRLGKNKLEVILYFLEIAKGELPTLLMELKEFKVTQPGPHIPERLYGFPNEFVDKLIQAGNCLSYEGETTKKQEQTVTLPDTQIISIPMGGQPKKR